MRGGGDEGVRGEGSAVAGVEEDGGGAEDVDVVGHGGGEDLGAVAGGGEGAPLDHGLADAGHHEVGGAAGAAGEDDPFGVEDLDEVGDAAAEVAADGDEDLLGDGVAVAGGVGEGLGGDVRGVPVGIGGGGDALDAGHADVSL